MALAFLLALLTGSAQAPPVERVEPHRAIRSGAGRPSHATLVTDVLVSKMTLCPGEPVKITVRTSSIEHVDVAINGATGQYRILQFRGTPGKRRIRVVAGEPGGHVESVEREVEVVECPGKDFPPLVARPNPYRPQMIDFIVPQARTRSSSPGTYVWNFGDGNRTTTTVPFVSHDYGRSVGPLKPYVQFEVTLDVPQPASPLRTSVSIRSPTYFTRQKGFVRLRTVTSRSFRRLGGSLIGSYSIHSTEEEPIEFKEAREERRFCDPQRPVSWRTVPLATLTGSAASPATSAPRRGRGGVTTLVVPPRQERRGLIPLREQEVPPDVCIVAYHLRGTAAGGMPARASLYFEARANPLLSRRLTDERTRAFLTELVRRKLVPDPNTITEEDLRRLEWQGLIRRSVNGWEVQP